MSRVSISKVLIPGVLLLAFALRLYQVTSVPLSLDEVYTIRRYVPLPVVEIFTTHHSNNQPLASLLAHLFSARADHLFMMRWPMILIGMLALPFTYRLGVRLFSQAVAILALLLLAVSPVHLAYSSVVRGYGGLILLTAASVYFLLKALDYNRWRDWLGFLGTNLLVIFFHLFGALAAAFQVGLTGVWLLLALRTEKQDRSTSSPRLLKSKLFRFGLVALLLAVLYPLLISAQTTSIFSEGRYPAEFELWRNGVSWLQTVSPFVSFLRLTGPISLYGLGQWIYLIFGLVGLAALWSGRRGLALAAVVWFLGPFLAILVAMRLIGIDFFAYVRFLLYLLPFYLILIAAGMVFYFRWLSAQRKSTQKPGQIAGGVLQGVSIVGLLALLAVSGYWYVLRSTHTNWPGIANLLANDLQPQDLVICEEGHGFDIPDRARAYCMWMLDFLAPSLQEYSPRFQNSTDLVANFDNLQEQRAAMLEPGAVWLAIWQKVEYNPGHLITDQKPEVEPPPPVAAFEPHRAWHFGSATLVEVDAEESRFDNLYRALELLLQVKRQPADRARYFRSLAEMEAVQGQRERAWEFYEQSRELVEQAGGQYPDLFLGETRQVIERIPAGQPPPEQAMEVGAGFGSSLCLQAYEVWPGELAGGEELRLRLYWQAVDVVEEDYVWVVRLRRGEGEEQIRLEIDPFGRVYPTAWWWPEQWVVEEEIFELPVDLEGQDYGVELGAYERGVGNAVEPVALFQMIYRGGTPPRWQIEPSVRPATPCP